jgi:hypothetical protein
MVNMGNVWDRTTEFLSDNLGAVVPIALLTIFVPQSISGAIKLAGTAVTPALGQGIVLALLVPMLWGQLAITALALRPDAGRGAAQATATRRFLPALAAMLILFGVIVLLFLPIVIALAANGVDLTALTSSNPGPKPDISPALAGFIGLYGLAWLVVAAFVSVRLSTLLFPVIAAEGGIVSALRRSFALSRGIAWKLLGVVLLFGLVVGVASIAVTSVFGTLFRFLDPTAGPFAIGSIIVAILGGLVTTAYYVIQSSFMAKVYLAATSTATREGM